MRILQVCNRIPYPPKDGGAIGFYNFIKSYHDLGQDLTLLAFNTYKHYWEPGTLPEAFTKLADIRTVPVNTNISPLHAFMNLFSNRSYNIERFDSPNVKAEVKHLLKEKSFDVIHLDSIYVAMYLNTIREYSNAKVVFRAHNVEYLIWQRLAEVSKPGPKKWYLALLAKRLKQYETHQFRKFDAILPISNNDATIIQEYAPSVPMHLTPAGVNMEDFNPDFNQVEFPSLFHLGSLDWMPNLEAVNWFLDKIWPKVNEANPEAIFRIAGRNMPNAIQQRNAPNVEMVGEVDDAFAFMNNQAIMVVPLLSGSGMRLKILEGMAMGKCVVATSIGAEGIEYHDGENIKIADSEADFAQTIIALTEDPDEVFRVGSNAIEMIQKQYTNQQIVKGLLSFYQNLVNEEAKAD